MNPSPFKFLDSYTPQDIGSFFGRDRETGELFRQCFVSSILVVYGGSGTGKTSLVQCGLASRFQESDWLPVPVRRSGDMLTSLREEIKAHSLTPSASEDIGELTSNLYLDHFKPIYFLFDQFEELFIFGGREENEAFFQAINALLGAERNVHVVFIVREEYLAELTRYEHLVPKLIENRYRVERMARSYATDVVERLCTANGIACAAGFSTAMVDRLNPEGQGVELSYLQVYLDRCWRMRKEDESFSIALLERIGYVDDLLGTFLEEQVAETPDPEHAESLLKTFVSDQGTKRQLTAAEAHDWVNVIGTAMDPDEVERLLQLFVSKRLLRDRDERGRFELLHDALARQIFQRITRAEQELIEVRQFVQQAFGQFEKRGAKLTANDLTYLRPYRNQLHLRGEMAGFVEEAFGEEERKETRRKRKRRVLVVALSLVVVGLGLFTYRMAERLQLESSINQSNLLAGQAMELSVNDPFTAYLIAERAFDSYPGAAAERALIHCYQFLAPVRARFIGNDVRVVRSNNSILVVDWNKELVRLYDKRGKLLFERHSKGVNWNSVQLVAQDQFILLTDTASQLIDLQGTVVQQFDHKVEGRYMDTSDSSFWVLDDDRLALWKGGEHDLRMIKLDTLPWGPVMRAPDHVLVDNQQEWLAACKGDSISLVRLSGKAPKWMGTFVVRWSNSADAPSLVSILDLANKLQISEGRERPFIHQLFLISGQIVAVGEGGLWQAALDTTHGLTLRASIDFEHSGIKVNTGDGSVFATAAGRHSILIKAEQDLIYSVLVPGKLNAPDLPKGARINFVDEKAGRLIYNEGYDRDKGTRTYATADLDGSHVLRYASLGDNNTANWRRNRIITVDRHDPARGFFMAAIGVTGDTLWDYGTVVQSSKVQVDVIGTKADEWVSVDEVVRFNDELVAAITLLHEGVVRAKFLKRVEFGRSKDVLNGGEAAIVGYSDSLIVLMDLLKGFSEGVPTGYRQRCFDEHMLASLIEGDTLRCHVSNGLDQGIPHAIYLGGSPDREHRITQVQGGEHELLSDRYLALHPPWSIAPSNGAYLVDLERSCWVDTGSFSNPAFYWNVGPTHSIVRSQGHSIQRLDEDLHVTKTVELEGPTSFFKKNGHQIVVLDRIHESIVEVVDIESMTKRKIEVPFGEFTETFRKLMIERYAILMDAAMDKTGSLVLLYGGGMDGNDAELYVVSTGHGLIRKEVKGRVSLDVDENGAVLLITNSGGGRAFGGSITTTSGIPYLRQVVHEDGSLQAVELLQEFITLRGDWNQKSKVYKNGALMISAEDAQSCQLCGDVLFSSHRLIDRVEALPLSGAEIIRLVREEKRFGEFWKDIDPTPLIKKALE